MRVERIGNTVLYLADCRAVMNELPPGSVIVSDPPYGQNHKVNTFHAGGTRDKAIVQRNGGTCVVHPNIHAPVIGDDKPFDPSPWLTFSIVVLWGAHKFYDRLPRGGGWFVWDKVPTGKLRDQGDGEAAWINRDQPMRIFRLLWDGLCVGKGARHEVTAGQKRLHPTQKPEALMRWCIKQATDDDSLTVVDPYMGSGSTGVAAAQLGRSFVGAEIDEHNFDIACERIDNAYRQSRMFA